MSTDPTPQTALEALRAALTHLRALAALPNSDPFYAQSAEQVEAVVTGLERLAIPKVTSGIPDPPSPGLTSEK